MRIKWRKRRVGSIITASNITVTVNEPYYATITWTTSQATTSKVEWGTTTSYGSSNSTAGTRTSHSQVIRTLVPDTLYHFRITNIAGSFVGSDNTNTSARLQVPKVGPYASLATTYVDTLLDWGGGVIQANHSAPDTFDNVYAETATVESEVSASIGNNSDVYLWANKVTFALDSGMSVAGKNGSDAISLGCGLYQGGDGAPGAGGGGGGAAASDPGCPCTNTSYLGGVGGAPGAPGDIGQSDGSSSTPGNGGAGGADTTDPYSYSFALGNGGDGGYTDVVDAEGGAGGGGGSSGGRGVSVGNELLVTGAGTTNFFCGGGAGGAGAGKGFAGSDGALGALYFAFRQYNGGLQFANAFPDGAAEIYAISGTQAGGFSLVAKSYTDSWDYLTQPG